LGNGTTSELAPVAFETRNPPATAPVRVAAAKSVSSFFDIGILLSLAAFRIVHPFPPFVE
jgi:hypothetical protein